MKTPHEYYLSVIGQKIDMDGAYGAQCWDLFAHFCKTAGYPIINCTTTGYAMDIANNKATNGLLKNFVEVSVKQMQDGDWVIWNPCVATPYSHVAMFRKDNGNGTGIFLGQNQGGPAGTTQVNIAYAGISGIFRPNCYRSVQKSNDVIAQEVLQGLWGNGDDRKRRLLGAGYDYAPIQAIINGKVVQVSPTKKTNDVIVQEVLKGIWGNGSDRKKRLQDAGYNAEEIQRFVNKKFS